MCFVLGRFRLEWARIWDASLNVQYSDCVSSYKETVVYAGFVVLGKK